MGKLDLSTLILIVLNELFPDLIYLTVLCHCFAFSFMFVPLKLFSENHKTLLECVATMNQSYDLLDVSVESDHP